MRKKLNYNILDLNSRKCPALPPKRKIADIADT